MTFSIKSETSTPSLPKRPRDPNQLAKSRRGVDMIFGFEKEADALQWIKEKSQGWLPEQSTK
jgi:hypothetical protein